MKTFILLFATAQILLVSNHSFAQAFEEILATAANTDEPELGAVVTNITEGGQAEGFGLEKGDFIVKLNDQLYIRPGQYFAEGQKLVDGDRILSFVKKDGRTATAPVEPGLIGMSYQEVYRPELAYLRGLIGERNPRWDRDVVQFFLDYEAEPASAAEHWKGAKEHGYPESDPLYLFIASIVEWTHGRGFVLDKLVDEVVAAHGEIPNGYYMGIARLAQASGDLDTLERLRDFNPPNSLFSDRYLKQRRELRGGNIHDATRSMLQIRDEVNWTDITHSAKRVFRSDTRVPPNYFEQIDSPQIQDVLYNIQSNAFQRSFQLQPPTPFQNAHVRIKFTAVRQGNDRDTFLAFSLSDPAIERDPSDPYKSNAMVGVSFRKGSQVGSFGYHLQISSSGDTRYIQYPSKAIKIKQISDNGIMQSRVLYFEDKTPYLRLPRDDFQEASHPAERVSTPITVDLIKIGGEAAIFVNGVSQLQMPVFADNETFRFGVSMNYIAIKTEEIKIWAN